MPLVTTAVTTAPAAAVTAVVASGLERIVAASHPATPAPPGTEEARRALSDELHDPAYLRSWWNLLIQWVRSHLKIPAGDTDLAPLLGPVLVALGIVVVAVVVAMIVRARRRRAAPAPDAVFAGGTVLTAEDHRRRAHDHLDAGRHEAAVIDAFRALATAAADRGEVSDSPDLTAHEVGRALARAHPHHDGDVRDADRLFSAVRYGDRRASADDARGLLDLDTALDAAATSTSPDHAPVTSPAGDPAWPSPDTRTPSTEAPR